MAAKEKEPLIEMKFSFYEKKRREERTDLKFREALNGHKYDIIYDYDLLLSFDLTSGSRIVLASLARDLDFLFDCFLCNNLQGLRCALSCGEVL